ncbi:MAG: iron-containing alcohol dehydrogenase [Yoonia sp.]|nr:iron-containing alcohol dehydrogenase [Yoonia sp.]
MGAGEIKNLGNIASAMCTSGALIVTDAGMVRTGIVDRAEAVLKRAGLSVKTYADVVADPPETVVQAAADMAKGCGLVIGLGGGSSLDVAKLAALLAGNGRTLANAYGVNNATGPRLPLILIPTTAGTGSEVTPIAIVTTGTAEKMGVVSPLIIPDIALLDPELTYELPAHVTAATGIDAMVHAIEAYASASPNNNPVSCALAVEALRLIGGALERAVTLPHDIAARADMLLGSLLAGQAFANSPVAAVHALAYPIGGHFKVPHGLSNALVLPHVLRFNAETHPDDYAALAPHAFAGGPATAAGLIDGLVTLSKACGLPQTLRDVGISRDDLPRLATDAMNQTRLLVNNPRAVTYDDALAIYEAAL